MRREQRKASRGLVPYTALLSLVALIAASLTLLGGAQPARALAGTYSLSATTYSATEGSPITITVNRSGDSAEAGSVVLTLSAGTAVKGATCGVGVDYTYAGQPGTVPVTFAVSDVSETVTVTTCASTDT